jgi:hypothetical protein
MTRSILSSKFGASELKGLWVGLGSLFCCLVWVGMVAPLIARAFGVRWIDWQNGHLGLWQYFWFVGVVRWGTGMFLFTTSLRLLEWKVLGEATASHSVRFTLGNLVLSLVLGMLFGYLSAPRESREA